MKRFFVLILAMVLAMGTLAGCGGKSKDENTLWIGATETGWGLDWLEASIKVFEEKYPEYNVEIHEHDAQFHTIAQQRIDARETINDLLIVYDIMAENYSIAGKLEDLTDVFNEPFGDEEGRTIEEALIPSALIRSKSHGVDGEYSYYSFPTGISTSSFILNRTVSDFYERLPDWRGKKIDRVETVNDLNNWVKQIMSLSEKHPFTYLDGSGEGPVKGFSYPGQFMNYWDGILKTWWVQYSGYDTYQSFFDLESVDVYKDIGRLKAYEAFNSLELGKTAVTGAMSADHISSQNSFVSGKSVLIPNGSWIEYESRGPIASWGSEIEMLPVPAVDSSHKNLKTFFCSNGNIALIPKRDNCNVKLAKKFLSFLFSKEEVLRNEKLTGSLAPYYNGYDDELIDDASSYSEFVSNIINLRNNADVMIADTPKTLSSPNYKMIKTGVASQFCRGTPYSDFIEKKISPKDWYDNELVYANANFEVWREQSGLK